MDKKEITVKETFKLAFNHHQKKNFDTAKKLYNKILFLKPNHFESVFLLGSLCAQNNEFGKAKQLLVKAVQIRPDFADAHNNLANVLKELNEYQKAIISYEKAIRINPNFSDAHFNLGNIFKLLKDFKKAIICYEKAIQINSKFSEAHNNLGVAFKELGELKKAIACYEKAIAIKPSFVDAHFNLGIVFNQFHEYQKAKTCYEKAIQINPRFADAHNNLGTIFRIFGEHNKSMDCYEKSIILNPDNLYAYSNKLFSSLYFEKIKPEEYLLIAKKFRLSLKKVSNKLLLKNQFEKNPKKLKVGFISGDFRQHPVGYFLLNTLKYLQSKDLELFAYSNLNKKDKLTDKLKSYFNNWSEIINMDDKNVVNQIKRDKIHILIDLSGHTRKNRLPIFINKPAPIQVTWGGYAASTGIPEIDYLIGDSIVSPPGEKKHFTEKIFTLTNSWVCFTPPDIEVPLEKAPAIKNEYITFGSFNNLSKINNEVISLWSRILLAIPKSKIFLKTKELNNSYLKKMIIENFKKNKIDQNSIILEGDSPRTNLLSCYNRVDLSLDPFPYSGGATTFESIWMGVPVLTKKGSRFVSRVTESINYNTGMSDWTAKNEEEYFEKAVYFSKNYNKSPIDRKSLRKKVLNSPGFNASLFAKQFNDALWEMWKKYKKN